MADPNTPVNASNLGESLLNAVTPENKAWHEQNPMSLSGLPAKPATNTIAMSSMSNINAPDWTNELAASIPNYFSAYQNAAKLPDQIDEWTANAMNRQRATGDQAASIFNEVGNQRAGSGIMGGTEYDNAIANYQTNLAKGLIDNKTSIEQAGNQAKANVIAGLPAQAMAGIDAMSSLYGQNAADQHAWANIAAQMINMGY